MSDIEQIGYGYCPRCGASGITRERRPNGNDRCANGHEYPSRNSVFLPGSAPSLEQQLATKDRQLKDLAKYAKAPKECYCDGKAMPHSKGWWDYCVHYEAHQLAKQLSDEQT